MIQKIRNKTIAALPVAVMFFLLLLLTACSRESSLLADASRGNVVAQYEVGMYYLEDKELPDEVKAFQWIKASAGARYRPAMRKVAEMYILGQGTLRDLKEASFWLMRYLQQVHDSEDAFQSGVSILKYASPVEAIAGLALLGATIRLEHENGNIDSELSRKAAEYLTSHMEKYAHILLEKGNYIATEQLLTYCREQHAQYRIAFPRNFVAKYSKLQSSLEKALNNN